METGDQRTHIDRSAPGSSRALDYLVSNRINDCVEAKIDNSLLATPYVVEMSEGKPSGRKYSDHKSILARFKFEPAPVKKIRQPTKFLKSDESRAKFALETDDIAEEGLEMMARGVNVKKIVQMVERKVRKAEYKTHKVIKPNTF